MICPKCSTRYEDDTLRFCLRDGTSLVPDPSLEGQGEMETVVTGRGYTDPAAVGYPPSATSPQVEPRGSKTTFIVVLTVLITVIILGLIGAGVWLYLRERQAGPENNTNSANGTPAKPTPARNKNTNASGPGPSNTAGNANNISNTPNIDVDELKRDVKKSLMTWRSMAESRDLDSYMDNYADTVDYYLKKGATKAFVRGDKQKAFDAFDSIKFDIDDIDVTVSSAGDEATVQFDKEWEFEGARSSKGKVRQELKMKLVNGAWLITSEKDLKEY